MLVELDAMLLRPEEAAEAVRETSSLHFLCGVYLSAQKSELALLYDGRST